MLWFIKFLFLMLYCTTLLQRKDIAAMEFTHQLFRQLMWRSSKSHVADELELPPQEEHISWLSFSEVEEHFYQRQHETCVDFAREVLERFKSGIHMRDCSGLQNLFEPLLKIGQLNILLFLD